MSVLNCVRRLRDNESGNMAMMFAIALVPIFGMVGAAIDYAHVSEVRAKVAEALDAGVLAVGAQPNVTEEQAFTIVNDWLAAHLGEEYNGYWKLDSVAFSDDGTIIASASGDVDTTVAKILGVDKMPIGVTSEAIRSLGKVEVVLALDNTGSMKGTKLTKLKEAATSLVESLAGATKDPEDLKISLVPFSQTVNVGPGYKDADWIDKDAKSSVHDDIFTKDNGASVGQATTYAGTNRFTLFNNMETDWAGCVESRPYPYDVTEAPPSAATPDTLYVPYFAPDEPDASYKSGGKTYYYYNNNYMNYKAASKWWGNQGNVSKYSKEPDRTGSAGALSYTLGPNSGCDLTPITRLTSDSDTVIDAIDDMVAIGNTHINVGLQWAWHALSPNAPFGDGVAYNDPEWTKVVVLMTDGNNQNTDTSSDNKNRSVYSGYGYNWQERFGTKTNDDDERTEQLDERLTELCANMKADDVNIVIYTVRVEVKEGSAAALEGCATEADNFKEVADISDLEDTFADIGGQIQKLRLKK